MSHLWETLSRSDTLTEEDLSGILRQLVQSVRETEEFPFPARNVLIRLLREQHEPHVQLQTCVLVNLMCNMSPKVSYQMARYGTVSCLASVLKDAFSSMAFLAPSSAKGQVYGHLVKFIMSIMRVHFAPRSELCVRQVLDAILLTVDINSSALYASGNVETQTQLEFLTLSRSLVGWRIPSPDLGTVYQRLHGFDLRSDMPDVTDLVFGDSFIVDLYHTDEHGDNMPVIDGASISEKLMSSIGNTKASENDGEFVSVFVTCVLDGAHFVGVFGAEDLECYRCVRQFVDAAACDHSTPLTDMPFPGELVYVTGHPKLGSFRAYVVEVNNSNGKILTFAPDCGYVEEVPLSWLKTLDELSIPPRPLLHVCKVFGQCCFLFL